MTYENKLQDNTQKTQFSRLIVQGRTESQNLILCLITTQGKRTLKTTFQQIRDHHVDKKDHTKRA